MESLGHAEELVGFRNNKKVFMTYDYAIVGSGIVGLGDCHGLEPAMSREQILLLEKEARPGAAPKWPQLRSHPFRHLLQTR